MEQLWGLTLLGTVQWQLAFRCGAYAIGYSWPLGVGPTLLGTVQWQLAFRCGASRYWVLYNCSWPLGVGPHAIGYCTMAAGLTLLGTVQWQLASRYWVLYNGSWPLGLGPHAIGTVQWQLAFHAIGYYTMGQMASMPRAPLASTAKGTQTFTLQIIFRVLPDLCRCSC